MNIFQMSVSACILILVVVVVRAIAIHRLQKMTFLLLWGVVLCRLLIPFTVPSWVGVSQLSDNLSDVHLVPQDVLSPILLEGEVYPDVQQMTTASEIPIVTIWFLGMVLTATIFILTHLRWRLKYKTALPIESEFVKAWKCNHPLRRRVEIRLSDRIITPLTYGILRPVVLLPKSMDLSDTTRLEYVLTHEFTHIKRFDIIYKWLLVSAVCVHWFNPLVWVMYVLANRDIELSCDEAVIKLHGDKAKSMYALALIGLEETKSRLIPLCNNFSKNAIEERIVAIMKIKKISILGIIITIVLVAGITGTALAISATQNDTNPEITETSGTEDFVLDSIETLPQNNGVLGGQDDSDSESAFSVVQNPESVVQSSTEYTVGEDSSAEIGGKTNNEQLRVHPITGELAQFNQETGKITIIGGGTNDQ